jgi:hypothetical protein
MFLHNKVATKAEINENTSTGQNCNTQLMDLSGPMRLSNIVSILYPEEFLSEGLLTENRRLFCRLHIFYGIRSSLSRLIAAAVLTSRFYSDKLFVTVKLGCKPTILQFSP